MEAALLNFKNQQGYKIAILGDMFELGKDAEKNIKK
jgi:UDP-N-acetylmuramoyl-tripeptide--D-alanyl-D-alanine ligase